MKGGWGVQRVSVYELSNKWVGGRGVGGWGRSSVHLGAVLTPSAAHEGRVITENKRTSVTSQKSIANPHLNG